MNTIGPHALAGRVPDAIVQPPSHLEFGRISPPRSGGALPTRVSLATRRPMLAAENRTRGVERLARSLAHLTRGDFGEEVS